MKPSKQFDLIVIGAGAGGLNVAAFMNRIGLSVLLIDRSDAHIGGDCLNFGCIPSKALIHVAREVAAARHAAAYGLKVAGEVDWSSVRAYIEAAQARIRHHENAAWFRSQGMTVVLGEAMFTGPQTVMVAGQQYRAKRIILATGSRPRQLVVPGIEQVQHLLTNETFFTQPSLPRRLLIIGAGPIGIELAQASAQLGVAVTVADPGERILNREDADMVQVLTQQLQHDGVAFSLGHTLQSFSGPQTAIFKSKEGVEVSVDFDAVLVAIGRVPNLENLNLGAAGIRVDAKGRLVVDRYLRTTNHRVLACGDVAGNFQFTHAAEMHAATIIRNFFSPLKKPFSGDQISWVTYTSPEIATFGLSPAQLQERGVAYEVISTSFQEDDRAITDGYPAALQKLYIDKRGRLLGGTMVAPHAGELIQELVLARAHSLPLSSLFTKTYAYPTATRINKRGASQYMARRLTPLRSRLLRWLY